jgi:hypothetical protein
MGFENLLPKCPACGELAFRVLETRPSKLATRRRKKCDSCGYRATTHEVSDDFFRQAKQNELLVQKFRGLLLKDELLTDSLPLPVVMENKCPECQYSTGTKCAFDLPEYDSGDSFDCNLYKSLEDV